MTENKLPLISCLCVTREKPNLLHRAINCFLSQTYPQKELVVVYDDDDLITKKFIQDSEGYPSSVCFFEFKKTADITLGKIRNYSIDKAKGSYICQWDDDDWYHESRLELQYHKIKSSNLPGCVLSQWLLFDSNNNKAYLSHKRYWEGSLLCEKELFPRDAYDDLDKGEDTQIIKRLKKANKLSLLHDSAYLYTYSYHGKNTWNYEHWAEIFKLGNKLSNSLSKLVKDILENRLEHEEAQIKLKDLNKHLMSKKSINTLKRNFQKGRFFINNRTKRNTK